MSLRASWRARWRFRQRLRSMANGLSRAAMRGPAPDRSTRSILRSSPRNTTGMTLQSLRGGPNTTVAPPASRTRNCTACHGLVALGHVQFTYHRVEQGKVAFAQVLSGFVLSGGFHFPIGASLPLIQLAQSRANIG